jgi:hypothetical protein
MREVNFDNLKIQCMREKCGKNRKQGISKTKLYFLGIIAKR